MKSKLRRSFFTAASILFVFSTSCLAVDMPEIVDINLQASNAVLSTTNKDSKKVPNFTHAKHATYLKKNKTSASMTYEGQFTCMACHAGAKNVEEVQSKATKEKQAQEVENDGGIKKYMHRICLDCHKSMKKAKIATGPTSCKGCHNPS